MAIRSNCSEARQAIREHVRREIQRYSNHLDPSCPFHAFARDAVRIATSHNFNRTVPEYEAMRWMVNMCHVGEFETFCMRRCVAEWLQETPEERDSYSPDKVESIYHSLFMRELLYLYEHEAA